MNEEKQTREQSKWHVCLVGGEGYFMTFEKKQYCNEWLLEHANETFTKMHDGRDIIIIHGRVKTPQMKAAIE